MRAQEHYSVITFLAISKLEIPQYRSHVISTDFIMSSVADSIVIVGSGVFGLTTALELKSRGHKNITILDRFLAPVPDGSSTDISRIVRADYADVHYAKMASEAQALWKTTYRNFYHPCGYITLSETSNHAYIEKSKSTLRSLKLPFTELRRDSEFKNAYPALISAAGNFSGTQGYKNDAGGWADAASAIKELARQCSLVGVSFVTGARGTVLSLRKSGKKVTGVNVALGEPIEASTVIIAAGAWSCRLIDLSLHSLSTCQPLGFLQLTPKEAAELAESPIVVNLTTGWFCFPPDPATNLFKVARHGMGYTNHVTVNEGENKAGAIISAPSRDKNGAAKPYLPADADKVLRDGLRQFFPGLADRPWENTRLCWYTDTPSGDFIIDYHPGFEGLFVATGGSGQ